MFMMMIGLIWLVWTVGVTLYFCMTNFWTAVRYGAGLGLAYYLATPALLLGFSANAEFAQTAAVLLWFHFVGSIFCPVIFGLTILPLAAASALKK